MTSLSRSHYPIVSPFHNNNVPLAFPDKNMGGLP